MAQQKRKNYCVTVTREFKARLMALPVDVHRGFAVPMRKYLEKLVSRAEQNGGR